MFTSRLSEVKRIRESKKQPLSSASLHALRDEYTRTIEPSRALAAERGQRFRVASMRTGTILCA